MNIGWTSHSFGSVLLPLGISFFTFTQIAYLIDLKEGIAEEQGLLSYLLFVTFFPHLIAGPIIHHSDMMPQFNSRPVGGLRADDMTVGLTWFCLGLAKKVLLADRCAPIADLYFGHAVQYGGGAAWIGALAYLFQLYFDFSGYSDMAVGLARMFSIDFPINFNSPYKSLGIIEFWQRWHITLSTYLNMYLYNPIALHFSRRRMDAGKKVSKKATQTLKASPSSSPSRSSPPCSLPASGTEPAFSSSSSVCSTASTLPSTMSGASSSPTTPNGRSSCTACLSRHHPSRRAHQRGLLPRPQRHPGNLYPRLTPRPPRPPRSQRRPTSRAGLPPPTRTPRSFSSPACFFIVWALPNTQEILGQPSPPTASATSPSCLAYAGNPP